MNRDHRSKLTIGGEVELEGAVARDSSAVGQVGELVHATRGADGPGEVRIRIRGGSEIYLAWSEQPLPAGTTVLVVESRGTRNVDVVPWAGPLSD